MAPPEPQFQKSNHVSLSATSQVWAHSRQESGNLLVLLALADYADDEGFCFPSVPSLAGRARITVRHCQRVLADLVASGELVKLEAGGGAKSTRYRVIFKGPSPDTCVTPAADVTPDTEATPTPDAHVRGGVTPMSPGGRHTRQGGDDVGVTGGMTWASPEQPIKQSIQQPVEPSLPAAAVLEPEELAKTPAAKTKKPVHAVDKDSAELSAANAVCLTGNIPDEIQELWAEWKTYRTGRATTGPKSDRIPWTDQAARMSARQIESALTAHPGRVVADRIRSAIAGNWQGFNLDKLAAGTSSWGSRNGNHSGQRPGISTRRGAAL